jgi:ABC-type nitrate/sulfonate/bicarbonate transport system substrate-binding protein
MIRPSKIALPVIVALALAGGLRSTWAQEQTVRVGMVRALSSTATLIAIQKGYFRDYGIKVVTKDIEREALSLKEFPAQRLVTTAYSDYAVARLGPFGLHNPDSRLAGCR